MIRAIMFKELRETRAFAALALALYLVYLSKLTGTWNRLLARVLSWVPGTAGGLPDFPFVQDGFGTMYGTIGFALANPIVPYIVPNPSWTKGDRKSTRLNSSHT